MTPEELTAATAEPIRDLGAKWYFDPDTLAVGKEMGLDGFRWYFLGRGGVLGDVEAEVIASAFGYFDIDFVRRMWDKARQVMAPREAATRYLECNADLGRKVLADADGLEAFCEAAELVISSVDPAALAVFAGMTAEPLPEDPPARALHLVAVLRELRGSHHLVAVVAAGVDPAVAHAIRRPDELESFGYAESPRITDGDRALLADADALTDRLTAATYRPLTDAQRRAFADGIAAIGAAFAAID